ncbi:MAG: 3'(2'), 5'-bisphosphate nucleotidase [Thiomicrorhabdus sp.]|nr:MAG: 3'(2'), 5'-bisphosphate nucleotidase [Thiomicrorhabdus sp.]
MSINKEIVSLSAKWMPEVCKIAVEAGQLISEMYHQSESILVEQKGDGSPVTEADKKADALICQKLQQLTPDIPLVTEESVQDVPFEQRKDWATYWLVDPLDGTKEFIERTGEFSVNIALIHNHQPVLGVVYGPENGDLYFSSKGSLAYKVVDLKSVIEIDNWQSLVNYAGEISINPMKSSSPIKVAVSRRHGGMIQHFIAKLGKTELVKMGSALKVCLVAEGTADVYPRFGPTSLWDTAASQCILESAGGQLLNAAGHPLQYVQTGSLLNPFFMATGDADYPWPNFPEIL